MTTKKEMQPLLRDLRRQGFVIEQARNAHYKVTAPNGRKISLPLTPGDHRSLKNVITRLKRIGYVP